MSKWRKIQEIPGEILEDIPRKSGKIVEFLQHSARGDKVVRQILVWREMCEQTEMISNNRPENKYN